MMSLGEILFIYRARLRQRSLLGQEILAILGIAVGVALLFASQVASTSLDSLVKQLTSELVGSTQWQLDARAPQGVSEELVHAARALPGVRSAEPIIEQSATVSSQGGRTSVVLLGVGVGFANTDVGLFRHIQLLKGVASSQIAALQGVALPLPVANEIGVEALEPVRMDVGAHSSEALVDATLRKSEVGALVDGQIVLAPIAYAQRLAGMKGHVSRVYVAVSRHDPAVAHRALAALAAKDRLDLEPAAFDASQFAVASAPAQQGEELFSAISAIAGFLFAFTSMLLTVPARRRLISAVRRRGTTRAMTVQLLCFDALIISILACVVGLALGDLLSVELFHANPGYLAFAFPVGSERTITSQTIAVAIAAGFIAAFVGVLVPLRTILARPLRSDASSEPTAGSWAGLRVAIGCLGLVSTTVILFASPQAAIVGCFTLALALVCLLPLVFNAVIRGFSSLQSRFGTTASKLAQLQLLDPVSRVRALAVATTGAVAVFGSVAILGAQHNLQSGLSRTAREWNAITDIWVSPRGSSNTLGTTAFTPHQVAAVAHAPGVASVSIYRGGFLNLGRRRVWVIAPPVTARYLIPPGQLTSGDAKLVNARLRHGGWVVLSEAVASELRLAVGESITLPTPNPIKLRIAGLSGNAGWPPGAVVLNAEQYAQAWASPAASALNVSLRAGVPGSAGRAEVAASLGSTATLNVQTASERAHEWRAASQQGLARLTQIATLVLIAAVLAMSIVMGSMIWQRRGRIARIKRQGFDRALLWRALLCESAVLLATGCLTGAIFGIYGQLLISHALATVTGFPIDISAGPVVAATSFAIVSLAALVIVALPGYLAVRVRPTMVSPA